jgi:hypothetical protein
MKRGVILLVCVFAISFGSSAQVFDKNALGLKFGGSFGDLSGAVTQISYQRGLNSINRLEFNLSANLNSNGYLGFGGAYQWVWNIEGGFNWYAGPGASLGFVDTGSETDMFMGVGGMVGLEYRFPEVPIQLSLDINPTFGLINSYGLFTSIGLGVRFCF